MTRKAPTISLLYHRLCEPDLDSRVRVAASNFVRAASESLASMESRPSYHPAAEGWPPPPDDTEGRQLACAGLIAGFAPLALIDGWWRDVAVSNALAHTLLGTHLARRYDSVVLSAGPRRWTTSGYGLALRSLGYNFVRPEAEVFANQLDLPEQAYCLPVYLLGLSANKMTMLPELCGSICFALSGEMYALPGEWRSLVDERFAAMLPFDVDEDPLVFTGNELADLREEFLSEFEDFYPNGVALQRLECGYRIARMLRHEVVLAIESRVWDVTHDPRDAMLELLRKRAPAAMRAHAGVHLEGQPLGNYFAGPEQSLEGLLGLLARSYAVTEGEPDASPLVAAMEQPDGGMYRIFNQQESLVVRRWIARLNRDTHPSGASWRPRESALPVPELAEAAVVEDRPPTAANMDPRTLFHHLLNEAAVPELTVQSAAFVSQCLDLAAEADASSPLLPPSTYNSESFLEWFSQRREVRADLYWDPEWRKAAYWDPNFDKSSLTMIRWDSLQSSPYNLTDGCWLQRVSHGLPDEHDITRLLVKVHWDEIGNGSVVQNHSNMWRRFLRQLGWQVPEIHSRDFSAWGALVDQTFVLPAFLMSISNLPRRYLPEIAGLTLFLEMSGSGGDSLRRTEELRSYGLDPTYNRVHNGADNLYAGHTLWARDIVVLLMDQARSVGQEREVWARVRKAMQAMTVIMDRLNAAILDSFDPERTDFWLADSQARLMPHTFAGATQITGAPQ